MHQLGRAKRLGWIVWALIAALGSALLPARGYAQTAPPLADRVPGNALLYVGWMGADACGQQMEGTHLKSLLGSSTIESVFTTFAPQLIDRLTREDAQNRQIAHEILTIAGIAWHHPGAFFVDGIGMQGQQPRIKCAYACQAGADGAVLTQTVQALDSELPLGAVPVRVASEGDLTCISVGYDQNEQVLAGVGAPALAGSDSFKAAMAALDVKPVLATYLDVGGTVAAVSALPTVDDDMRQKIEKVMTATGLNGLKTWSCAEGFDGADWECESFAAAPAPRSGLMNFDATPVSQDLLKQVPRSAVMVAATRFDLAGTVTGIRDELQQINPQAAQIMGMGLGAIQLATAVKPIEDVMEPLGPDWAIYTPADSPMNMVVVNKLRDPATAKAKLPMFQIALTNLASAAMRQQHMMLQTGTMSEGDNTIFYFDVPLISPAWAIKDDYFYLGLYPQSVVEALRQAGHGSILDEPKFQAVMKRLGDKPARSLSYVDLPQTAAAVHSLLLLYERLGAGFAAMYGVAVPEPVIPPLDSVLAQLAPAGSVCWVDDAGIHCRSIYPFPGSGLLGLQPQDASIGVAAASVSILLPSLNRAREQANRIKCASNERQIGQAILLYTNGGIGKYPPDLGELLKTQDLAVDAFICPDSGTKVPSDFAQMTKDQQAAWVDEHSDYIYVGKDLTGDKSTAETVVLYEKRENHGRDGMNILFGDGHVEFDTMARAQSLIESSNQK
jgi:prepilin-type processing-associated H-X9-DG protein